jgi:phosphohistidine phosphatase
MRRRLVLLRHGESGWDGDPPTDHERNLTEVGQTEAQRIGEALRSAGWTPDQVVCSSALRARQTAELAAPDVPVTHHQEIYSGGLHDLSEVLGLLGDEVTTAWAVGHNPSFSGAASALSGSDVRLSTANAACLEVEADSWEDAMAMVGAFSLVEVLTPH